MWHRSKYQFLCLYPKNCVQRVKLFWCWRMNKAVRHGSCVGVGQCQECDWSVVKRSPQRSSSVGTGQCSVVLATGQHWPVHIGPRLPWPAAMATGAFSHLFNDINTCREYCYSQDNIHLCATILCAFKILILFKKIQTILWSKSEHTVFFTKWWLNFITAHNKTWI